MKYPHLIRELLLLSSFLLILLPFINANTYESFDNCNNDDWDVLLDKGQFVEFIPIDSGCSMFIYDERGGPERVYRANFYFDEVLKKDDNFNITWHVKLSGLERNPDNSASILFHNQTPGNLPLWNRISMYISYRPNGSIGYSTIDRKNNYLTFATYKRDVWNKMSFLRNSTHFSLIVNGQTYIKENDFKSEGMINGLYIGNSESGKYYSTSYDDISVITNATNVFVPQVIEIKPYTTTKPEMSKWNQFVNWLRELLT